MMSMMGTDYDIPENVIAMMKLELIVKALNEGWVATEHMDEKWWYPWFYRFDKNDESKYEGRVLACPNSG